MLTHSVTSDITDEIIASADASYKDFQSKLIPGVKNVLGLRSPKAKQIAKKYANTDTGGEFLRNLPHKYYDENIVHGYMLGYLNTDAATLEKSINDFLPFVDNWAVCDTMCMNLKSYFKKPDLVYEKVKKWAKSDMIYIVRFALVALLAYYAKESSVAETLDIALSVKSDEYYIKMAQAWLISVAIVKFYDIALPYIENKRFDAWVHNKGIQKARESYRISAVQKDYLNSLKVK